MQWRRVLRENGEHSVDRTFLSPTSLRNFLVDVQKSSQKPSVLTCARSLSLFVFLVLLRSVLIVPLV